MELSIHAEGDDRIRKKKPGSIEPGLRYWPREADTITFQEGLLNARATGGGGQMRNAKAQRGNIMNLPSALQQAPGSHVRHAEIRTARAAPCSPRSRGIPARVRPSSAPPDRRNRYRAGLNPIHRTAARACSVPRRDSRAAPRC